MAEVLNPDQLLEKIGSFPPLARVLLATTGTLQTTLSAFFGSPVVVEVTQQDRRPDGTFHREVNLVRKDVGEVVVQASTTVEVDRDDVRELVEGNEHGLGQILILLGIPATFELEEVGEDHGNIWRRYHIRGDRVAYTITEVFPRAAYSAIHR
jgi:chorismate-pyruvate lyase